MSGETMLLDIVKRNFRELSQKAIILIFTHGLFLYKDFSLSKDKNFNQPRTNDMFSPLLYLQVKRALKIA
jgi:hypothetical protein